MGWVSKVGPKIPKPVSIRAKLCRISCDGLPNGGTNERVIPVPDMVVLMVMLGGRVIEQVSCPCRAL